MPQAVNFTIKDGATTPADVLFTLLTPAAGTNPAAWAARSKGPQTATQPKVELSSEGFKGGRRVKGTIKVPSYVTDTGGATVLQDTYHVAFTITIADKLPQATKQDGAAYFANLLDVASIKETLVDGYAPA